MNAMFLIFFFFTFQFHPSDSMLNVIPNITVDINGMGNYTSINQAMANSPNNSFHRFVIYIKQGVYNENVTVPFEKSNITFLGDGMERTIISGNRSNGTGYGTDTSATLTVQGDGFLAMLLTVENTAGPTNEQAVALLSDSAKSAFYQIMIKGFQDSLYIKSGPQIFSECYIYGTLDFIFGEGPAVLKKCQILVKQSLQGKSNAITANGCERRLLTQQQCGFSFHLCNITGDIDLFQSKSPTPTYLGRPWKKDSTTVFMQSYMTNVINSTGWLPWNETFEKTVFYGEFNNSGAGASVESRVKWPGVHSVLDRALANNFTVSKFIGDTWVADLGVRFVPGLV